VGGCGPCCLVLCSAEGGWLECPDVFSDEVAGGTGRLAFYASTACGGWLIPVGRRGSLVFGSSPI
jgi:hypothetical protein